MLGWDVVWESWDLREVGQVGAPSVDCPLRLSKPLN